MFITNLTKKDLKSFMPAGYSVSETEVNGNELLIYASPDFIPEDDSEDYEEASFSDSHQPILKVFCASDFSCGNLPDIKDKEWQIFMLDRCGKRYFDALNRSKLAEPETKIYYKEHFKSENKIRPLTEYFSELELDNSDDYSCNLNKAITGSKPDKVFEK